MFRALIFGGTTEGRQLAELCADHGIPADISVTTELGARLIPQKSGIRILVGQLDLDGMRALISRGNYSFVLDATHPFAAAATENIRAACECLCVEYYRVVREDSCEEYGEIVESMDELITLLNRSTKRILSTLGSKETEALTRVSDYKNRVWLRVLPDKKIVDLCEERGFIRSQIILGRGPFSEEENIRHIGLCGAEILVTKDSGKAGGYHEKVAAARQCGIGLITLRRPRETGFTMSEIRKILLEKR